MRNCKCLSKVSKTHNSILQLGKRCTVEEKNKTKQKHKRKKKKATLPTYFSQGPFTNEHFFIISAFLLTFQLLVRTHHTQTHSLHIEEYMLITSAYPHHYDWWPTD